MRKLRAASTSPKRTEPESPAAFRHRAGAVLDRAGVRAAHPVVRAVFLELLDILCEAYEFGGMPEVQRVWVEAKRVLHLPRKGRADGRRALQVITARQLR